MFRRIVVLGLLAAVGCGGSDSNAPAPVLTTLTVALSPNAVQVGQTSTATATGVDQNGAVMAIGTVTWTSSSAIATVAADGKVTAVSAGSAIISGAVGGKSAQAVLTIVPLPGVALSIVTGPPATVQNRIALTPAPVVQVVNSTGGPVAQGGLTVTASASVGNIAGVATAVTDGTGRATFTQMGFATRTLGPRNLVFTAPGMTPASVSVNVTVGPPVLGFILAGDAQTAVVGKAVAIAPSVRVTDPDTNPTPGISMEFVVSAGGGSTTGSPVATTANGVATVGSWILGPTPGTNSLQVRPVTFSGGVPFTAIGIAAPTMVAPFPALRASRVMMFESSLRVLGCTPLGCR